MPSTKFSPDSLPDLSGKVYIVTGGNAGIGRSTVVGLAAHGAKVYMGARSESRAQTSIEEIKRDMPSAEIHFLHLDLGSFQSVLSAARRIRAEETVLHGLVNNAGIMGVPFATTNDDYEIQFQTNYLAHWLLTFHLLPLLLSTSSASTELSRLINVTSDGHTFSPKQGIRFDDVNLENEYAMTRYGQSKLANILHTKELNRRYGPGSQSSGNICFAAVHPGHIDTNLNPQATGSAPMAILRIALPIMRCVGILDKEAKGALSSLFAIASKDFKSSDSGAYVIPYAKIGNPSENAQDSALASKLWDWTERELSAKGLLDLN